jgi:hypothetical protein
MLKAKTSLWADIWSILRHYSLLGAAFFPPRPMHKA